MVLKTNHKAARVPCQSQPQISKFEIMSLRNKGLHSVKIEEFFYHLDFMWNQCTQIQQDKIANCKIATIVFT